MRASGLPRERFFVSTKIHPLQLERTALSPRRVISAVRRHRLDELHFCKESVASAVAKSCEKLGTDTLDLCLLHCPWENCGNVFAHLVEEQRNGRVRSVGVCYFSRRRLEAFRVAGFVPAVNQIEISPYNTQKELVEFCRENGIVVMAASPFCSPKYANALFAEPKLVRLAKKYGKTVPQIILNWLLRAGVVPVPRASTLAHLAENTDVFDFELSATDAREIDSLDKGLVRYSKPV